MTILELVQQLGVQWTRSEQERRLFALCVQVQATLRERHGDAYHTPDVSQVPEGYVHEAKEIVASEVLLKACRAHQRAARVAQCL